MQTEAERVVGEYSDLILRLSYTYLGSAQDAEDICQNVLLKLITSLPFTSSEHERAWVIRVTANACKDLLKSAARQRSVGLEALEGGDPPAADGQVGALADDTPVARAVQALPVEQREAVHLYYYEGYQIDEIARMTGSNPAAVAKRLSRARETLRKILGRKSHE